HDLSFGRLFPTLRARMNDQERLQALEERLGMKFLDRSRALTALSHRSHAHERTSGGDPTPDNERLEFLGDAVIDLAVSQRLMEADLGSTEGELSKRRAAIVNEGALA